MVGQTLAEIAENAGISPEEALLATVRASEGRVSIIGKTVSVRNTKEEVKNIDSFIASDGAGYTESALQSGDLVHPRSFGAFPHFWHRFVNELGLLSAQDAIKKITSGPAQKLGLTRRGALAKGNFADIAIFNPQLFREHNTYRNPYHYPAGMDWVFVNGNVAVENGSPTHARSGRVIKRG